MYSCRQLRRILARGVQGDPYHVTGAVAIAAAAVLSVYAHTTAIRRPWVERRA